METVKRTEACEVEKGQRGKHSVHFCLVSLSIHLKDISGHCCKLNHIMTNLFLLDFQEFFPLVV